MQDCEIVTTEFAAAHWAPVLSRILVPTDFSWRSDVAVDCAFELTRKMHAQLTILHVRPEPSALDYTLGISGRRLGPNEGRGRAFFERRSGTRQATRRRSELEVELRLGYSARDIEHGKADPSRSSCSIDAWIHRVEASVVWQRRGENRRTRALSDSCRALTQFDQPLGDATFGQSRERNFFEKTRVALFRLWRSWSWHCPSDLFDHEGGLTTRRWKRRIRKIEY
jgi:Universal stress protein family